MSVLAKPLRRGSHGLDQTSKIKSAEGRIRCGEPQALQAPPLPLSLPSEDDWLVKVIAIQGRFVLGMYRRQMKAISYLGQIEKRLGVPTTTRNWNTIAKVAKILQDNA